MPTQAAALSSPPNIKQEDRMQDDDEAPLQPAAAADAELGSGDSLASLLAACPPSFHTGIVDSVCRCEPFFLFCFARALASAVD
jgi:hypothetical protein